MKTRNRSLGWLGGVIVVVTVILFFWWPTWKNSVLLPVRWKPQPNSFPLGTVLQGSSLQMSLGLISDVRPPQPPSWVSRLPQPMRRWVNDALEHHRAGASKRTWQIKVEAPDFLRVDKAEIDYHSVHGSFPTVNLHLAADRLGSHDAPLTIRLSGAGYDTHTLLIPVNIIIAKPSRWAVLVTETPFERYSTGNGSDYESLAAITSRLAEQGVRIDFRDNLPKLLDGWNVILLGGGTLAQLEKDYIDRLQLFVARGGRLIVSADAFFGGQAAKANDLLNRYGLRIDSKDAGQKMQASQIAPDALTADVSALSFWRPACVWTTDSKQARVLAGMKEDEQCGFIVSLS